MSSRSLCGGALLAGVLLSVADMSPAVGQAPGQSSPSQESQLFQFEPDTPERLVNAIIIADSLGRPLDARRYIRKLTEMSPNPQQLLDLRKSFGVGQFLKFNANPELQPDARILLNAINEASRQYTPTDARLQDLAAQLAGPSSQATDAIVELLSAKGRAVPPLLALDPATPAGKTATGVLQKFARELRFGLLAALPSAADSSRSRLLSLLSTTADPELAPELYRWRFDASVSNETQQAAQTAIRRLSGDQPVPETSDQAIQLLQKEIMQELQFAGQRFSPQSSPGIVANPLTDAERASAADRALALAKDAVAIAPDDVASLNLLTLCQFASSAPGLAPAPDTLREAGPAERLPDVLQLGLKARNPAALIGTLNAMKSASQESGNPRVSETSSLGGLLREALQFPDPRVRLLAARLSEETTAIAEIPAAMRIVRSVREGSLKPEAVVIHAEQHHANELSVALEDAGYSSVAVQTGAQGFEAATAQLNCELILVESNSIYWDLPVTIANLRADARTRWTPIVIFGPVTAERSARGIASRYPGIWFISEPVGPLTLKPEMAFVNVASPLLSEADRQAMKALLPRATDGSMRD